MHIGVMMWAGRGDLDRARALGFTAGQLGIEESTPLADGLLAEWRNSGIRLETVFCAYEGENYADIASVAATVGFVPEATRERRVARTLVTADFAARLGVRAIACHIGCVPEDPAHPDWAAVRDAVRRVCDHAARHRQVFALETGQETAAVLARFLGEAARPNLRVNFDPANMILYGSGEPLAALDILAPWLASVHAKDGVPPEAPGKLGRERPLGEGAVGLESFVAKLRELGYSGILSIEREAPDQAVRWRDIAAARNRLIALLPA